MSFLVRPTKLKKKAILWKINTFGPRGSPGILPTASCSWRRFHRSWTPPPGELKKILKLNFDRFVIRNTKRVEKVWNNICLPRTTKPKNYQPTIGAGVKKKLLLIYFPLKLFFSVLWKGVDQAVLLMHIFFLFCYIGTYYDNILTFAVCAEIYNVAIYISFKFKK